MSENIYQLFQANPASSMVSTDLLYLGRSPYTSSDDFAITWANLQASITAVGTIGTGVWEGTKIAITYGGTGVTSVTTAPTASSFAGWDANSNLSANNVIEGYATTATAAAITTLTVASAYQQFFTGTTTQTAKMPVVTTLVLGQSWLIVNNSTGAVTVESSGANSIVVLAGGAEAILTCIAITGTTAASWNAAYVEESGSVINPGSAGQLAYYAGSGTALSGTTTGTGVLTALGVAVGSSGAFVVYGGALGTPSSGTLTSCTGLPIAGITGLGTNVATALGDNLNGTGAFAGTTSPVFVTPTLGAATATSLTFSPTTDGIVGTTTNDSASTGYVGEYIAGSVISAASFSSSAMYQNMTSIPLGAGDWDVFFTALLVQGGAGIANGYQGGISTTSITPPATGALGCFYKAILTANDVDTVSGITRVSLASSGTAYLVGQANWTSGTTPSFYCQIGARRVR